MTFEGEFQRPGLTPHEPVPELCGPRSVSALPTAVMGHAQVIQKVGAALVDGADPRSDGQVAACLKIAAMGESKWF